MTDRTAEAIELRANGLVNYLVSMFGESDTPVSNVPRNEAIYLLMVEYAACRCARWIVHREVAALTNSIRQHGQPYTVPWRGEDVQCPTARAAAALVVYQAVHDVRRRYDLRLGVARALGAFDVERRLAAELGFAALQESEAVIAARFASEGHQRTNSDLHERVIERALELLGLRPHEIDRLFQRARRELIEPIDRRVARDESPGDRQRRRRRQQRRERVTSPQGSRPIPADPD